MVVYMWGCHETEPPEIWSTLCYRTLLFPCVCCQCLEDEAVISSSCKQLRKLFYFTVVDFLNHSLNIYQVPVTSYIS